MGYGISYKKWISVGINSGFDSSISQKLVAVPVFGNFTISPSVGSTTRLVFQLGYGKGFAIGRGNLSGDYHKISLGIEPNEDVIIFIETSGYNFRLYNQSSVGAVSLGLAVRTF